MTGMRFSGRRLLAAAASASIVAAFWIAAWQLAAQETAKPTPAEKAASEKADPNQKDSAPSAKKERPEPRIIIAQNVLLWEGERIMTWNEIVLRLRLLRRDGPFQASFLTTRGVITKHDE